MKLVVKLGGSLLETAPGRARLAACLQRAAALGHRLVVVHGGGKQIAALAGRLGLVEQRHEGLRITDAATAQVVTWVLAGEVNKALVQALQAAGLQAVGICGADLGLFRARRKTAPGVDLGFVGTLAPADVHAAALTALLELGIVPVVATIGPEAGAPADQPFLNVNADEAAGPIAAALGADELVLLSDVPGVLDRHGRRLPRLTRAAAEALIADQTIRSGMVPKVRAALDALAAGVKRVRILSGDQDDPIAAALSGDGTEFQP